MYTSAKRNCELFWDINMELAFNLRVKEIGNLRKFPI